MNDAVRQMLQKYACQSAADYEHALREIFQEIALLGLWRGKFFEHAAFYGGTALRILHGLDRFSEDMDFSLLAPSNAFDLSRYSPFIEKELFAWGFRVQVETKKKAVQSAIESAFLKADTLEQLLLIETPRELLGDLSEQRRLRIKIEVDISPPPAFDTEFRYLLDPIPFAVRSYAPGCLFAGKLHALLFRSWKNRVKGRDWYDLVWYCARKTPVNLTHLAARMKQTENWPPGKPLLPADLNRLLREKIEALDITAARNDAVKYIRHPEALDLWSREFFIQLAGTIKHE